MIRRNVPLFVVLSLSAVVAACSESTDPDPTPAAVIGTVTDASGAPVADAAVVLDFDFAESAPALAPDKPSVMIRFDLPDPVPYELRITDLCDEEVFYTLTDSAAAPGTHAVVWNGLDAEGRAMGEGVYRMHLLPEGRDPMVHTVALARNMGAGAGEFATIESPRVRAEWRIAARTDDAGRFRIARGCWEIGASLAGTDESGEPVTTYVVAPRVRAWAYAADRPLGASSGWIAFDGGADATADIVFGGAKTP